jgi:DNA-binding Lrp family transcriptional regulator
MDGWWDEIDAAIVDELIGAGPMSPEDLGRRVGMSTDAVCSCLAMLAAGGRVHITSVEATRPRVANAA